MKIKIVEINPPPSFHAAAPANAPLNRLFTLFPPSFFLRTDENDTLCPLVVSECKQRSKVRDTFRIIKTRCLAAAVTLIFSEVL